jgi:hypothetical protein
MQCLVRERTVNRASQMKKRVVVWSDEVEIDVVQKSKTVWRASGQYKGRHFESKAQTPGAAAKAWADAARYHNN